MRNFDYFISNCKNYKEPDYVVNKNTPWMYRCKNFNLNGRFGYNCYDCIHNTTEETLEKLAKENLED